MSDDIISRYRSALERLAAGVPLRHSDIDRAVEAVRQELNRLHDELRAEVARAEHALGIIASAAKAEDIDHIRRVVRDYRAALAPDGPKP